MTDGFNAYAELLQIAPSNRAPNHYELLDLPLFANDFEQIRSRYWDRMEQVRKYEVGNYTEYAVPLLEELSQAFQCLSDPQAKAEYDGRLRTELASSDTLSDVSPLETLSDLIQPATGTKLNFEPEPAKTSWSPAEWDAGRKRMAAIAGVAAAALLLATISAFAFFAGTDSDGSSEVAQNTTREVDSVARKDLPDEGPPSESSETDSTEVEESNVQTSGSAAENKSVVDISPNQVAAGISGADLPSPGSFSFGGEASSDPGSQEPTPLESTPASKDESQESDPSESPSELNGGEPAAVAEIGAATSLVQRFWPQQILNYIGIPAQASRVWKVGDKVKIGDDVHTVAEIRPAGTGTRGSTLASFDIVVLEERPAAEHPTGTPVIYLGKGLPAAENSAVALDSTVIADDTSNPPAPKFKEPPRSTRSLPSVFDLPSGTRVALSSLIADPEALMTDVEAQVEQGAFLIPLYYDAGQSQLRAVAGFDPQNKLHGLCVELHENQEMKQAAYYKNGARSGRMWAWSPAGELILTSEFTYGRPDGLCCLLLDGQLRLVMEYNKGKLTGIHNVTNPDAFRSYPDATHVPGEDTDTKQLLARLEETQARLEDSANALKQQIREEARGMTAEQRRALTTERSIALGNLIQLRENARRMLNQKHINGIRARTGF